MRTVVLNEPGHFEIRDTLPPDSLPEGEALVRIRRVGVCGTDIHAYHGNQPYFTYPRILGHELACEIIQIGSNDRNLNPGDLCAVEPYINCGDCIACRRGRTNCCSTLKVLGVHIDGGMREQIQVPVRKLHRSDKLTLDQLALVETLCIGAHAVSRAKLEKDERILVLGAGPIGLTVMQFAKEAGVHITVADVNPGRLAFCRDMLGVHQTLVAGDDLLERLGSDLPTAVFDATGSPACMESAFKYVANSGRLIFVGLVQADIKFHDPEFHRKEMTLLATRNATAEDFRHVMSQIESGAIDTRPWITHRESVELFPERFASWLKPDSGLIKGVVEF